MAAGFFSLFGCLPDIASWMDRSRTEPNWWNRKRERVERERKANDWAETPMWMSWFNLSTRFYTRSVWKNPQGCSGTGKLLSEHIILSLKSRIHRQKDYLLFYTLLKSLPFLSIIQMSSFLQAHLQFANLSSKLLHFSFANKGISQHSGVCGIINSGRFIFRQHGA